MGFKYKFDVFIKKWIIFLTGVGGICTTGIPSENVIKKKTCDPAGSGTMKPSLEQGDK